MALLTRLPKTNMPLLNPIHAATLEATVHKLGARGPELAVEVASLGQELTGARRSEARLASELALAQRQLVEAERELEGAR